MGLGISAVTSLLELYNLGYLKGKSHILDIGSQELHLHKNDLKNLCSQTALDISKIDSYPNIEMYPSKPRCSSKYFWKSLGIENNLIRLSVGIEDCSDLIKDLDAGLKASINLA